MSFRFQKKNEIEEILSISDFTPFHLQHEKIVPRIIQAYKKLRSEESSTDGYFTLLMGYARSLFRIYGSFLRFVAGLDEDDIQLILKQFNSYFITYDLPPGIYTI